MARRGRDTLAFGPMKPVGLADPRSGSRPHAVVQLRQEDKRGDPLQPGRLPDALRVAEQQRVFRMLPGLGAGGLRALRLGAPQHLRRTRRAASGRRSSCARGRAVYVAGQIAGVEGYVESAALGLLAGIFAAYAARGEAPPLPDEATAHGALLRHLSECRRRALPADERELRPLPAARRRAARGWRAATRTSALAARALARLAPYAERVAALVA